MIRKRIIFVVPLLYCGTFCPTFPLFRFSSCLHSRLTLNFFSRLFRMLLYVSYYYYY